eukprot:752347-Hanusia_phi.AAC.5
MAPTSVRGSYGAKRRGGVEGGGMRKAKFARSPSRYPCTGLQSWRTSPPAAVSEASHASLRFLSRDPLLLLS